MLDQSIVDQLKSVFSSLEDELELVLYSSSHEKQSELEEMLSQLSSINSKIMLKKVSEEKVIPSFSLHKKGVSTGVSFRGIPGGHEFTSLIIAILNADGKGKLPDAGIVRRIKNLKSFDLRTYVSLSCENCPEVVQALNLISLINPSISHEMVNGELVTEEVESLKIQGVPSVFIGDGMIISGKSSLGEIISKLEEISPAEESQDISSLGSFDVVVIGAGPAGVSSSIYLARKGLSVAIVAGNIGGQVKETKGIENMISVPYTEGPSLVAQLMQHVSEYKIEVFSNREVLKIEDGELKSIILKSKESLLAKKIIVATGAKWRELNIAGEKEFLGKGVAFCPHCDGPFYKGKDIAVIGGGNSGVEAAIDLSGIVKSVTLIEYNSSLKADKVLVDKLMQKSNIKVLTETKTLEIIGDGKVSNLKVLEKGDEKALPLDGIFVPIGLVPNSQFIKDLVSVNKFGEIIVDEKGRTSVDGIYAAGDVTTTPYKQIIISMGDGAKAALTCFEDLVFKSAK